METKPDEMVLRLVESLAVLRNLRGGSETVEESRLVEALFDHVESRLSAVKWELERAYDTIERLEKERDEARTSLGDVSMQLSEKLKRLNKLQTIVAIRSWCVEKADGFEEERPTRLGLRDAKDLLEALSGESSTLVQLVFSDGKTRNIP